MTTRKHAAELRTRPIYIFLHIPKCAGSTFRYHINKNMSRDERINFNSDEAFRRIGDPHVFHEVGWNSDYDKLLDRELNSLTSAEKDRIRVIQGHGVFHGIHKHFDRECRYITFIRNPVSRTVSEYNYLRMLLGQSAKDEFMREIIVSRIGGSGGDPIEFENWLRTRYVPTYQMSGFLHARKFLDATPEDATQDDLVKALDRFHFVSTTERFDQDSLYIYHKLGISKFYANKNISKPYFRPSDDTIHEIERRNATDKWLYDLALDKNRSFREERSDYEDVLARAKRKKRLIVPLTSGAAALRELILRAKSILRI